MHTSAANTSNILFLLIETDFKEEILDLQLAKRSFKKELFDYII